MKIHDNFYDYNIKNNPNKKLTPVVLVGNISEPFNNGIRDDSLTDEQLEIVNRYQDFDKNMIFALAPHSFHLKFSPG